MVSSKATTPAAYLASLPPEHRKVIAAVRDLSVKVPVVVRMKGNNEEKGRQMLKDSGLNFATADGMTEAAEKVVTAANGGAR